jgi:Amidase
VPTASAPAVAGLIAAGAIPIGKTNLDQFATGLAGVRTPYPVPSNAIDPSLVPGGSSSGSAVAVALGIVPIALGTDTAGSGRVPAALNGIVGVKPSRGLVAGTTPRVDEVGAVELNHALHGLRYGVGLGDVLLLDHVDARYRLQCFRSNRVGLVPAEVVTRTDIDDADGQIAGCRPTEAAALRPRD